MRTYQIIVIIVGLSSIGALLGYVGYIIWDKIRDDSSDEPPHIILIIADDVGWNDVSFHGADQVPTPNIDALGYNGVILNRHYVLPTCTPSRTSLMTGRYAIREGMQGVAMMDAESHGIPLDVSLMPEFMRDLGYETRLLGKWHLGYYTENHTPTRRGFDSFFGYYNGYISYFNKTTDQPMKNGPNVIGYDLHRDGPKNLSIEYNNTQYFTDLITDEAERIIKNNGNKKPLFLEIAHLAAHATYSLSDPLEVRNATENDETFAYVKNEKRRKHAGIMKAMDESVGRVVKALSDADMLKKSIIVFMSDNGAPTIGYLENGGSNYPLRGIKNTLFEGGIRGAACIFSPLIEKSQRLSEEYIHVTDWLPTLYSAAGGNVSNLGEIDGLDQWDSLVHNLKSPRENILLNIDEVMGSEAAIIGRHKLVKGVGHAIDGYFGDTGVGPSNQVYSVKDALDSPAGLAISRIHNFFSSTEKEAQQLRDSAVVSCEHRANYSKCLGSCIFDIVSDPCESQDLSKYRPQALADLQSFISSYQKFLVRQPNRTIDECSFPKYFNGTWMPWRRDDANSSTIIDEKICHRPVPQKKAPRKNVSQKNIGGPLSNILHLLSINSSHESNNNIPPDNP